MDLTRELTIKQYQTVVNYTKLHATILEYIRLHETKGPERMLKDGKLHLLASRVLVLTAHRVVVLELVWKLLQFGPS